ncbi:MAG: ribose-phosphate pyrophosphokinase [Boseongicola sp.]|nr:ribose-phosphate pyrophosphokinase [Boseongicola sp.]
MMVFSFSEAAHLAKPLAEKLGIPLAPIEDRTFEDGEGKLRPLTSVRGEDVYVLQSLHGDETLSVHDRLCRLLFFIATLRDHGAARITAVAPYLCYARKDRRTKSRDPLTLRYVAQMLEAVGCDRVVALEVHNLMAFQNAFRCQTLHIGMEDVFGEKIFQNKHDAPLAVVSPDPGGIKRAQILREALEAQLGQSIGFAFADKRRSAGVRTAGKLSGDVNGKHVIIADDLISTGGTLVDAATACRANGAKTCIALAAHGLFSDKAPKLLSSDLFETIIVSDSTPPLTKGVTVVSCASALADALNRLANSSHH